MQAGEDPVAGRIKSMFKRRMEEERNLFAFYQRQCKYRGLLTGAKSLLQLLDSGLWYVVKAQRHRIKETRNNQTALEKEQLCHQKLSDPVFSDHPEWLEACAQNISAHQKQYGFLQARGIELECLVDTAQRAYDKTEELITTLGMKLECIQEVLKQAESAEVEYEDFRATMKVKRRKLLDGAGNR